MKINKIDKSVSLNAYKTDSITLDIVHQRLQSKQYRRFIKLLKCLLICAPFAIVFFMFQIEPMLWVLINSFKYEGQWSLYNYTMLLDDAFIHQAFYNSFYFAFLSSLISTVIALVFINSLQKQKGFLKNSIISFINMCSNFSGVPLAFAFIIILGMNGFVTLLLKDIGLIDSFSIYSKTGILVIYTYFQIPLAILLLYGAFDALKQEWYDAARMLGANFMYYVFKVALPILTPAILGTMVILIANALGAYASIYALTSGNYNILTVRIASLVSGDIYLDPNMAAAISMLLLLSMSFVVLINQLLLKRTYHAKKR